MASGRSNVTLNKASRVYLRKWTVRLLRLCLIGAVALVLSPTHVPAETPGDGEREPILAHHKGLLSSINVGTRFSSVLTARGITFYDDYLSV